MALSDDLKALKLGADSTVRVIFVSDLVEKAEALEAKVKRFEEGQSSLRQDNESDANYIMFLEWDTNELKRQIVELQDAIKEHASQRLDDRCWKDDLKLYKLVGIEDHPGLPMSEAQFVDINCRAYWKSQQTGEPYQTPKPCCGDAQGCKNGCKR